MLMICRCYYNNILVKINYIVDFYNKKKEFNTCRAAPFYVGWSGSGGGGCSNASNAPYAPSADIKIYNT